jgi:hypothetical protein
VHMDDPRPSGRAEFDRGREPPNEQRVDEVMVPSVRAVMPANAAYCRPRKTPA